MQVTPEHSGPPALLRAGIGCLIDDNLSEEHTLKSLMRKAVTIAVATYGTQGLAHHSDEPHFMPFDHLVEAFAAGLAILAMASLVVLLLKASR